MWETYLSILAQIAHSIPLILKLSVFGLRVGSDVQCDERTTFFYFAGGQPVFMSHKYIYLSALEIALISSCAFLVSGASINSEKLQLLQTPFFSSNPTRLRRHLADNLLV